MTKLAFFCLLASVVTLTIAVSTLISISPMQACARELPGGYTLLSFQLDIGGREVNCRYVKRGVR